MLLPKRHLLPSHHLRTYSLLLGFVALYYGDHTVRPSALNTLECHPEVTDSICIAFGCVHHSLRHMECAHPLFVE